MVSVGWEADTLEIEFTDGAIYQYYGVSPQTYKWFMSSPSLGSALSRLDKQHSYARVQ